MIPFPALSFLIKRHSGEYVLFDMGYGQLALKYGAKFPNRLYNLVTPMSLGANEDLVSQLANKGVSMADITYVVLSHFHTDHLGDIVGYPDKDIVCSKSAVESVKGLSRLGLIKKTCFKELLPAKNAYFRFIETFPKVKTGLPLFSEGFSLFPEDDLILIHLPGHAKGQYGLYLPQINTFLVSDAAWSIGAIMENRLPPSIVRFIKDDWAVYKQTFKQLHALAKACPQLTLLPTHDLKALGKLTFYEKD